MRTKIFLTLIFWQTLLYSQSNYSVYFDVGNANMNEQETSQLTSTLKQIPPINVESFTIYVYHDDTGNEVTNSNLSKKRVDALKKHLTENNYLSPVYVYHEGEIKIENINTLSDKEIEEMRSKNRRIDVVITTKEASINNGNYNSKKKPQPSLKSEDKMLSFTSKNNLFSIFYSGENNSTPNNDDLKNLLIIIQNTDIAPLKSLTLNTYNEDSGNKIKNSAISKKRAEELKKIIQKNNPNISVIINYRGDLKTEIKDGLSDKHIQYLKNKNRKIDIVANYKTDTTPIIQKTEKNKKNIIEKKQHEFSKKNNTYSLFYKGKNNTTGDQTDIENLINALNKIDTSTIKSIALNVYNDDSGNKNFDDKISKNRADNLKKALANRTKFDLETNYKGNIKTESKEIYSAQHVEYLKDKNKRIDVVVIYIGQSNSLDIKSLNLAFTFSQNNNVGDKIYLKNAVFPNDKSSITKDIARELDMIALQLKKYSKLEIEIQGHICCTKGGYEAIDKDTGKIELSTNRAKATYNYLVKKNIDPKRLRYKGYGNTKPLGYDEQLDKRIEFQVLKS